MFIVYKITNKINNKIYIGLTSKTLEERWYQHYKDAIAYKDDYAFHAAIRKYGKENFNVEEIENNLTEEQAKEKEIYYIKFYNSYIKDNGYNMTFGGDLNTHLKGENSPCAKITEQDFWNIIDLLQNTILSYNEIIEKLQLNIGERNIGEINSGDNWHHDELKYPIRDGKSISKVGAKNGMSKLKEKDVIEIIEALRNNISQAELAKKYNVHYNTINNIARQKTWKYLWK